MEAMKKMTSRTSKGRIQGRVKRLVVGGLAAAVMLGGAVSQAWAQGATVRYSYEEARVGDEREFILVPVAEPSLRGEVTPALLEQAFERLRQAKRPTYGNAYASVSGSLPNNARVEVHIPQDKARYAPIIIAEAVYTLTEFGVKEVFFPGHAEGGVSRGDIAFPAYSFTIPLWRAIPSTSVGTGQVRMPDGELVALSEVQARWRNDREALVGELYRYLESNEDYTVRAVARILPEFGPLRLDKTTPLLTHRDRAVREQGLELLKEFGADESVMTAILEAMKKEPQAALAREMAEVLGSSKLPHFAVERAFYLIDKGDDEEAIQAVESLSGWKDDERVVSRLVALLRDQREALALAAAKGLDELGVNESRQDALKDQKVAEAVRFQLAEDLAAVQGDEAVQLLGLTYLAEKRSGIEANQAILAMAKLSSDAARAQVEGYLKSEERSRRLAALSGLRERNDVASVAALMGASGGSEEGPQMAKVAQEIMSAQSQDVILEQTGNSSLQVQKVAYLAIGESAQKGKIDERVRTKLKEGTQHRSEEIRGASARAFGEIGGAEAIEILGEMLGDSSPVVRRDVIRALGKASRTAHSEELVKFLDDRDPQVVAAAIDAMEMRQDQQAAARIRGMVGHDNPTIRASALRAVTTFIERNDATTVRQHMGLLSGAVMDASVEVRLSALEQLGRFNDRLAVTNIALQVGAPEPVVRAAALRALAATGHESARPLLESALGDQEADVRLIAIESLAKLQGAAAKANLQRRLEREEDPQVREFLQATIEKY